MPDPDPAAATAAGRSSSRPAWSAAVVFGASRAAPDVGYAIGSDQALESARPVHRLDGGGRHRRLPVGFGTCPGAAHAKIAFIGSHSVRKSNAVHAFASTIGRAGRSVEVGREVSASTRSA